MKIMLLNDSETFTDLAGCRIVEVPDGSTTEQIEQLVKDGAGECLFAFEGDEPARMDDLATALDTADLAVECIEMDPAAIEDARDAISRIRKVWDIDFTPSREG